MTSIIILLLILLILVLFLYKRYLKNTSTSGGGVSPKNWSDDEKKNLIALIQTESDWAPDHLCSSDKSKVTPVMQCMASKIWNKYDYNDIMTKLKNNVQPSQDDANFQYQSWKDCIKSNGCKDGTPGNWSDFMKQSIAPTSGGGCKDINSFVSCANEIFTTYDFFDLTDIMKSGHIPDNIQGVMSKCVASCW